MTRIIKNGSSTTRDLKPARERPDYPSSQKRKAAIKLFEMGVGYKNAANILGLSVYTVRDWLRDFRKGTFKVELNVNQFRYAQETKDRVIALRKEGFSWSELSKATGVNMSTCRQWYAQFLKDCEGEEKA